MPARTYALFQFHEVQLKGDAADVINDIILFQFHEVQLKAAHSRMKDA